jgi:tRNA-specific 2-thiouridylase
MRTKAISLLSGGLDSTLATKLIADQDIDVTALHFTSPFASRKERERGLQAVRTADELKVRLIFREKGADYLSIIENPRHGYGKNMNPCIDCRIYMLRETRKVMEEEGASFVITGEVLGQRPMSQMRHTIGLIERESGLADFIVRPLSATHFEPSRPEREGIVNRARLLGITGRSRKEQNELARAFGLKEFGHPAGGCLLTDPLFSLKLKDFLAHQRSVEIRDISLLSLGRHFRLNETTKLILGRDQEENEKLRALWSPPDALIQPFGFKGPTAILQGLLSPGNIQVAANIIAGYSKDVPPTISFELHDGEKRLCEAERVPFDSAKLKI